MSNDYLPPSTDPALYPRVPDLPPPGGDDVLVDQPPAPSGGRSKAKTGAIAGIVAAGALAVGIGVAVSSHGSAAAQSAGQPGAQGGQFGPGQQGTGTGTGAGTGGTTGQGPGALGGAAGGQMVMGTVTAVGGGSITVKTTAATTTYTVSSSTQITVNGATSSLSAIKTGATVMVQLPTSGASTTATRIIVGAFGGTDGGPGGGRGGGVAGEQHITGTITALTASSITVKSTAGTATYQVNGTTEITNNGATATLSSLKVGTTVTVHVYPSGSSMMAERIIVGTDDLGPGGFGGPPGQSGQQGQTGAGTTTGQQAPATTT